MIEVDHDIDWTLYPYFVGFDDFSFINLIVIHTWGEENNIPAVISDVGINFASQDHATEFKLRWG